MQKCDILTKHHQFINGYSSHTPFISIALESDHPLYPGYHTYTPGAMAVLRLLDASLSSAHVCVHANVCFYVFEDKYFRTYRHIHSYNIDKHAHNTHAYLVQWQSFGCWMPRFRAVSAARWCALSDAAAHLISGMAEKKNTIRTKTKKEIITKHHLRGTAAITPFVSLL